MATTLVASNAAKNNAPALEDKSEKAKLIDFGDPISSRTLTVEETFKRMEVRRCYYIHILNNRKVLEVGAVMGN